MHVSGTLIRGNEMSRSGSGYAVLPERQLLRSDAGLKADDRYGTCGDNPYACEAGHIH